jgi:hypothetical protein
MSGERLKKALDVVRKDHTLIEKTFAEFNSTLPTKVTSGSENNFKAEDKKNLDLVLDLFLGEMTSSAQGKKPNPGKVAALLDTIRRLVIYKALFKGFGKQFVNALVECLKNPENAVMEAAIHAVDAVLTFEGSSRALPSKQEINITMAENQNRNDFNSNGGFQELIKLGMKIDSNVHADLVSLVFRVLGSELVASGSRSTPVEVANVLSNLTNDNLDYVLKLTLSKNKELAYSASIYIEGIIIHARLESVRHVQEQSLKKGYMLKHLYQALTPNLSEQKESADWLVSGRSVVEMQQDLFGLLVENNSDALKCLFRILPRNFQDSLAETLFQIPINDLNDSKYESFDNSRATALGKASSTKAVEKSVTTGPSSSSQIIWAKYTTKRNTRSNWPALFRDIEKVVELPHLVWTAACREDLERAIVAETEDFDQMTNFNPEYNWDYHSFEVNYPALDAQLAIDSYYVRLLIPALETDGSNYEIPPASVAPLVTHLYNRAVIEDDEILKLACFRAMFAVYKKYKDMLLTKVFDHMPYIVWALNPKHASPNLRDLLLNFLLVLMQSEANARCFYKLGGIDYLIAYLADVHRSNDDDGFSPAVSSSRRASLTSKPAAKSEWNVAPPLCDRFDVAHRVIELLTELFDKIPRIRKLIARSDNLHHMLQFLLCDDKRLSRRMVGLLRDIINDCPWLINDLVKTGFFEFLLFAIPDVPNQCYIDIFELINKYHLIQSDAYVPKGQSAISSYFPSPMIRLLYTSGPEVFLQVFNSQKDEPHLQWDQNMRQGLSDQLRGRFYGFKSELSSNTRSIYHWSSPDRIVYPSLDLELCVGTMYLRIYNERKHVGYNCSFPEYWVHHLVNATKHHLDDRNLAHLLDAHKTAVERHSILPPIQQYEHFQNLFRTLKREIHSDTDLQLVHLTVDSIIGLITLNHVNYQKHNSMICFEENGIDALIVAFLNASKLDFTQSKKAKLIIDILSILDRMVRKVGQLVVEPIAKHTSFVSELTKLVDHDFMDKFPLIAIEAMTFIRSCSDYSLLRQAYLESGAVVFLLYVTVFGEADKSDLARNCVSFAAEALSGLCGVHPQSPKIAPNDGITRSLRALLTPGLFRELQDPQKYLALCRAETFNPVLIWNDSLRNELRQYMNGEIEAIRSSNSWKEWQKDEYPFKFKGLADEIFVDDVYVYAYNKFDDMIHNPAEQFMGELLGSIVQWSLLLDTDQKLSDDALGAVFHKISTCSTALSRLINWHPEVLNCQFKDFAIKIVGELFQNVQQNPNGLHAGLLVLEPLVALEITAVIFVYPFKHVLHRLLNFDRKGSLAYLPSLNLTMNIISQLCVKHSVVLEDYYHSGLVITLFHMLCSNTYFWPEHRVAATKLLGLFASHTAYGEKFLNLFCQLTAYTFKENFVDAKHNAQKFIKHFDSDIDTPVKFWTEGCRKDLLYYLEAELEQLKQYHSQNIESDAAPYNWDISSLKMKFKQHTLNSQINIDEIYVNAFNSNPFFQVKPEKFSSKLYEGIRQEWKRYTEARDGNDPRNSKPAISNLISMWEAVRHLLTNFPHLVENFVPELSFLFGFFGNPNHVSLQEIALKVAHVVSSDQSCADNIVKSGLMRKVMPLLITMESKTVEILKLIMDLIRRCNDTAVKLIRSLGGIPLFIDIILRKKSSVRLSLFYLH